MRTINFIAIIAVLTETDQSNWSEVTRPESGNHADRWFRGPSKVMISASVNETAVSIKFFDRHGDEMENTELNFDLNNNDYWARTFAPVVEIAA